MARDREIFQRVEDGENAFFLRIYQWSPAALSLGAHQEISTIDQELAAKEGIDIVRRITGGGAILHDNELTYSFAAPREFFSDPSVPATLRLATRALQRFYAHWGLKAELAEEAQPNATFGLRTAACFAGKERWDLQIDGRKIGGNAQKRGRRAVFQHGSLPLSLDWERVCRLTHTPASVDIPTGLEQECRRLGSELPDAVVLRDALEEAFVRTFDIHPILRGE